MPSPTRRASIKKSSSRRSKPPSRRPLAKSMAKSGMYACRSTARRVITTPSAAGKCSPTTRKSWRCRIANCVSKTRWMSMPRRWPVATSKSRWNRSVSVESRRNKLSRSSFKRYARQSGRKSSMPILIVWVNWLVAWSNASTAMVFTWISAAMPRASSRVRT